MRELQGTTHDHFQMNDDQWQSKTTEIANVGIVEAMYRGIEKGDLDAFKAQLSSDIELEIVGPPQVPFTGRAVGIEPVIEFVMTNFSILSEQNAKITEVVAQGDVVVAFGQETGKFKTGQDYEIQWVQRFSVADKRIVSIKQIFDTAKLPAL